MVHYVYVVECSDGSLYTGYTTDVGRRIDEHNAGDGAKYTAGRRPVALRYVEYHDSRSAAQRREYRIKNRSREGKERLLPDDPDRVGVDLSWSFSDDQFPADSDYCDCYRVDRTTACSRSRNDSQ